MPQRTMHALAMCALVSAMALAAGDARSEPLNATPDFLDAPEFPVGEPLDLSTPLPAHPASKAATDKFIRGQPSNGWEAKVGVDYQAPPSPVVGWQPEQLSAGAPHAQSSDVGWAKVTAPSLGSPLSWDKAMIETRIDPHQEQGKLGTTLSRSVPVGDSLSVTWQNGLSLTETRGSAAPAPTSSAATSASTAPVYGSNQALRFNVLPTDTALSVGAAKSSTDERWLRSLSAEQKLLGGPLSVTGSVSETSTGELNKSLKAGFKKTW